MDAKQMVFNLGMFSIFYGLKPQGLFALDSKIYRFSAWQLAHDLLSTGTKIMQSLSEVDSLSDWHVERGVQLLIAFTSPWGPTKTTILKLIDLHTFLWLKWKTRCKWDTKVPKKFSAKAKEQDKAM